jgi:predicted nucleotidyltransferase
MLLISKIHIIGEFLRDSSAALTGSFIAKKTGMNQKTVSNFLKELETEHILKSKVQGKNKLYFLNLDNMEIVLNFLMAVEHLRVMNFYKKNIIVKEIVGKILPFVQGIGVIFGSYASGNQKRGSDLDILVVGKCNEREIDKISELYKIDISLKIYPKLDRDILIKEVLKNHVVIKNADDFIRGIVNG